MPYEMMRVKAAADYACVSKSLLDKLRCYGEGPVYYKLGSSVIYNKEDLDAWIATHRTIPPKDSPNAIDDGVPTTLYRHYDEQGRLLYIGISLHAINRLNNHMRGSDWRDQIAKVEMVSYPSRMLALQAERQAIKDERPRHNVIHNKSTD